MLILHCVFDLEVAISLVHSCCSQAQQFLIEFSQALSVCIPAQNLSGHQSGLGCLFQIEALRCRKHLLIEHPQKDGTVVVIEKLVLHRLQRPVIIIEYMKDHSAVFICYRPQMIQVALFVLLDLHIPLGNGQMLTPGQLPGIGFYILLVVFFYASAQHDCQQRRDGQDRQYSFGIVIKTTVFHSCGYDLP